MADSPVQEEIALLDDLQRVLGYRFQNPLYLREALTHASGANHRLVSNERLEFLGDSILGAVVCELLYHQFPTYLEGDLTRVKSVVVSRKTCAKISEHLGLHEFLILGKGMGASDQAPSSVLADLFESIVGAMFLDGGYELVRPFIVELITPEIEAAVLGTAGVNYKSQLQQIAQRRCGATPTYLLLDEKGPDHEKCFKMTAQIAGEVFAPAWGRNKKDAEQRAALNALSQLAGKGVPPSLE